MLLILIVLCAIIVAVDELPTATVDSGIVVGTTTWMPSATAAVNKYLSVPFEAPPARF